MAITRSSFFFALIWVVNGYEERPGGICSYECVGLLNVYIGIFTVSVLGGFKLRNALERVNEC